MPQNRLLYVGATGGADPFHPGSLAVYRLGSDGRPTFIERHAAGKPGFLCLDDKRLRLYSVESDADGRGQPGVAAWAIERETGRLGRLNAVPGTGYSAHVALLVGGTRLASSNYGEGTLDLFAIGEDGTIGPLLDTLRPLGAGPHPRQAMPHPHMAIPDPSGRWLIAIDLGRDCIEVFEAESRRLVLRSRAFGPRGGGLRHAAFHPHLPLLYVVAEMACLVHVFDFDSATGRLGEPLSRHATLPAGEGIAATGSGIDVSPDGSWLAVGNRARPGAAPPSDSLALFPLDPTTGTPGERRLVTDGIIVPRALAFDPSDGALHVANQKGGTVGAYRQEEGAWSLAWQVVEDTPMTVGYLA